MVSRIIALCIVIGLSLYGATQLKLSDDAAEAMLPTDAESAARYADYLARFPSDQGALVVFEDLICTEAGWALLQEIEATFDQHPMIDRTLSLASRSSRYMVNTDDVLELEIFAEIPFASAQQRCAAAMAYAPFQRILISPDGRAAALFLITTGDDDAVTTSEALLAVTDPYLAQAEALGGRLIVTGEAIMSAEISRVVAQDSALVGVLLVLMLILLFITTRSWRAVLAALLLNLFVLTCAYGIMGLIGQDLTPATSLVVFLLVPLASAFVVHAYGYVVRAEHQLDGSTLTRNAFLFAGLTTAIGFACTGLTPAPDIRALALMGVIGIAATTSGVFLIVFPLLKTTPANPFILQFSFPRIVLTQPLYGWALLALLASVTALGLSMIKIDYAPTDYLPGTNAKRADFDAAGAYFGRMNLPLMIEVDDTEDPQPWQQLAPLIDELNERYPTAFQASWFYDHMAEVTRKFTESEDPASALDFPTDRDTFAQLLLWFDPYDLELFMDEDRERLLILLQIPYLGSHDYYQMKALVTDYLQDNNISGGFVGRVSSFFETGHRIGGDNLKGLAAGAMLIYLLLYLMFRSFRLATIGVVVNGLPVLMGLAFLGIIGAPLEMGSSVVAAMAFGIVLDDSTHLLIRIQQLVRSGYDPATAVTRGIRELLPPIVTTTGLISIGFLVLYLAEIRLFQDFATVISVTLVSALITDVWILPLLVRRFMRDPITNRALGS
ncbi:MAG: efflux RND transporter permease subunit [Pseudomonadota bacterium]